jgi:hypothetical protein
VSFFLFNKISYYKKMPYTRKRTYARRTRPTVKRIKKRAVKKFMRNMRKKSVQYNAGRSVIANRYLTKLVYSDSFNLSNAVGSTAWQQFRINDLFDPDFTGGGHQPMGFDQFCPTLFSRFVVTGCKVVVEGRFRSSNLDTAPVTGNFFMGAHPVVTSNPPSGMSAVNESRQYISVTRTDQERIRIVKYYDNAKVNGISRRVLLSEENYSGNSSSSPQKSTILNVGFTPTDITTTVNCQFSVTLVYYVQFYSPVPLAQS